MSGEQPARALPASATRPDPGRRETVTLLALAGLATALPGRRAAAADPAKLPPQPGDGLVFAAGERKGQAVTAAGVDAGEKLPGAWAVDPASGTVRSGSRLHRVLLVRLDPAALDAATRARAAGGGIVAYSGFCTHAGCVIEHFKAAEQAIYCHCHSSQFDPRAGGRVVAGPARRPLAGLPVGLDGDRVVVAGEFAGKLGVPKA